MAITYFHDNYFQANYWNADYWIEGEGTGTEETIKGGWLPPKIVKKKLKKKDESILESIYELVEKLEEVPAPAKLKERAKKVEIKAKKAINLNSIKEHDRQIEIIDKQIKLLEKSVNLHIKTAKQDEDDAINALLTII